MARMLSLARVLRALLMTVRALPALGGSCPVHCLFAINCLEPPPMLPTRQALASATLSWSSVYWRTNRRAWTTAQSLIVTDCAARTVLFPHAAPPLTPRTRRQSPPAGPGYPRLRVRPWPRTQSGPRWSGARQRHPLLPGCRGYGRYESTGWYWAQPAPYCLSGKTGVAEVRTPVQPASLTCVFLDVRSNTAHCRVLPENCTAGAGHETGTIWVNNN